MCRSLAEGGQRCASHTRPAYESALVDYDHACSPAGQGAFTPPGGMNAAKRLTDAAAHYASTREGAVRVGAEADARTGAGDVDTGALLGQAVQQGQRIRQAAQDTAGIVRVKGDGAAVAKPRPAYRAPWSHGAYAYDEADTFAALAEGMKRKRKSRIVHMTNEGEAGDYPCVACGIPLREVGPGSNKPDVHSTWTWSVKHKAATRGMHYTCSWGALFAALPR